MNIHDKTTSLRTGLFTILRPPRAAKKITWLHNATTVFCTENFGAQYSAAKGELEEAKKEKKRKKEVIDTTSGLFFLERSCKVSHLQTLNAFTALLSVGCSLMVVKKDHRCW